MPDLQIERLLAGLSSSRPKRAWADFLEKFSPLILQVVRQFDYDEDRIADCYLFVCEHLAAHRCKRLRSFDARGTARFTTWLRAVVRNLCLDWRRSRYGRPHFPARVLERPAVEGEIYKSINHHGRTLEETVSWIRTLYPKMSKREVHAAIDRLDTALAGASQRLKPSRQRRFEAISIDRQSTEGGIAPTLVHPDPDPEEVAKTRELAARIRSAVEALPPEEKLVVRLRFEEELTLAEIAKITGRANPQAVDRLLRKIQRELHEIVASARKPSGVIRVRGDEEEMSRDE